MSPTSHRIYEQILEKSGFINTVTIGILETPSGYEVNAIHGWSERIRDFYQTTLSNYAPIITQIHALRSDGIFSTNNPRIVGEITKQQFIYCGAGSPSYTIRHLKNSLAYKNIQIAHQNGTIICLGSAAAIAFGTVSIPVYEIYKVGEDAHLIKGLNFFQKMSLCIVPHWNNKEGQDFDTSYCFLGKKRFKQILAEFPITSKILGIDELTACIIDEYHQTIEVLGEGSIHVGNKKSITSYSHGHILPLHILK